jgi:multiple sugar transport system permease protein
MSAPAAPAGARSLFDRLQRPPRPATQEALVAYLMILPGLAGILVFLALPILASFGISLLDWNVLTPPRFAGAANYARLWQNPEFWSALRTTVSYSLGIVSLGTVTSLALALALNQALRGIKLFRTLFFLPVVASTVAVALLWRWLYAAQFGLFNYALSLVGIEGPDWLGDPRWALPAVILFSVWKVAGYNMVIFLAGLQGIPRQLYEQAAIDGANAWQRFRHVTLPLLSPTTFFVLVVGIIGSLQVFDQVFVMTNGGPARSTVTLVFYVYENGFRLLSMGYAAAVSWILFLLILAATLVQWRLQRSWVHYG